ncbi:MAG: aldolase/citrate lyase family protein [Burkholderiaceae bacterium]|nr:aldolase/citrate lyase family protein [Burkholderiaceae bacterium]
MAQPNTDDAPAPLRRYWFWEKLQAGQRGLGSFVFSPDPSHTEILAASGFDLTVVDLEHAPLTISDVVNHVRAADAAGISCWVRVGDPQPNEISRLLDCGVQGVILPHFGLDPEATRAALRAFRYAPQGNRGTCTGVRSVSHGLSHFPDYVQDSNRKTMAIGLIEDADVVDNIEAVLTDSGVDAVVPGGPGDLATSMGLHGQGSHPRVVAAARRVVEAAKAVPGLKVGMYVVDADAAAMWADLGVDFLLCSIDNRILARAYRNLHGALRSAMA